MITSATDRGRGAAGGPERRGRGLPEQGRRGSVLRRRSRRLFAGAAPLVVALTLAPLPAAAQQVGLPIGAVPDAVELEDFEGGVVSLADYVGKGPVLVQFWATWCEVCEALEPRLRAAADRWGEDVAFVMVAVGVNQSPRRVRRYLERHAMHGTVLWDGRGQATRAFKAPTTGYIVILDADGRVVYTGVGEDQRFETALARVAARD